MEIKNRLKKKVDFYNLSLECKDTKKCHDLFLFVEKTYIFWGTLLNINSCNNIYHVAFNGQNVSYTFMIKLSQL